MANDFKVWAPSAVDNIYEQADYEALPSLDIGQGIGIADQKQYNKTLRQATIIAALIGEFIEDITGNNAIDDGTITTLLANFKLAVKPHICAYADLPTSTATNGQPAFVTNGRKGGEGSGAGTGVPVYFNTATGTWLTYSGNTAVTI